jgi:hypothetical protein
LSTVLHVGGAAVRDNRLVFDIDGGPAPQLWYEVDPPYAGWLRGDRYDPAVVALIPFAMKHGATIHVDGGITGALLHGLRAGVVPILAQQLPTLRGTTIEAQFLDDCGCGTAVVTGLSGGVDSYSTIAVHLHHPAAAMRISHLSFHDVGSHGPAEPARVFEARLRRARESARALGYPLVEVRSNLAQFQATLYQQHHTLWNASVAMALRNGVGTYLYSSTVPYRDVSVRPTKDIALADPIVLGLMSWSGVRCVSANAELTRLAKTELIADDPLVQATLDVCVKPLADARNCSVCWKCCRAELTLDLLGKLDAFSQVFDLAAFRRVRAHYIAHLLAVDDPHGPDLVALARQRDRPIDTLGDRMRGLERKWLLRMGNHLPAALAWRLDRWLTRF